MSARFTIGRQLSVSFFAVAVAVLAIGASTLHGVSELADINQRITGEGAERYTLVMRFERDIAINGARTWSLLKTNDKAYIAATHKEIDEASAALDRLEQKIRERSWTDEGRAILMRSEQARDAYRKVRADLISRHTRGEEVAAQVDAALGPSMKAYQDALGALAAHEQGMFESAALQGAATATRTRLVVFSAIAGATVAVFGLGLWLSRRITRRVKSATRVVRAVATGDLQTEIVSEGSDEVADLLSNLEQMTASLRTLIASMGATAAGIRHASSEIAAGSLDLSGRTETAASNLQQTASNMMQISQSVSANADSARQANQLAMSASEVAERGGSVVGQVVSTMDGISESSNRIAEIISVIDGIAFQTNILALNAAVEAARAGEQGRGFAVVAGEVRNLAQRSADAARQIKELISSSVAEVENGSRLVKDAGATMHEIVTSVRRVADIIGEITSATLEQTSQITQITSAIGQLESMTSQNAALVEQSSAAAESLTEQAQRLAGSVAGFRIGREQSVALDSPPERRASTVPSGLTPRSAPSAPAATTRPLASPSRTPAADDALLRPRLPARQAPAASSPSLAAGAQPTAQSGPQGSGTPSSSLPKAVAQPASVREADDDWESF